MQRKTLTTLLLAAALIWGAATESRAVDFTAQGEWLMGFGGMESTLVQDRNGGQDIFAAQQRLRLQLEAAVSENLSGVLHIQIGDTVWGKGDAGGALGADGRIVAVRDAYIDWLVPNTALRLRMGIQGIALPNAAGGAAVLDEQSAGVAASWKINDNVALTALWARPFNDNYAGYSGPARGVRADAAGLHDNADYIGLTLPLTFAGIAVTPWALWGQVGRNAVDAVDADGEALDGPVPYYQMPLPFAAGNVRDGSWRPKNAYAAQWYAGLPISITAFDPLTIELDVNYGYAAGFGRYTVADRLGRERRADTRREGWLVKGLAEYKLDWGAPGLLAWYGSGDDDNVRNGSERMPAIAPSATFTSFLQDGPDDWSINGGYERMRTYAGTWGLGVQLADLSFAEGLRHTLRVAYWGGTNSPAMIRQTSSPQSWNQGDGLYLTTLDHLWEINLDTKIRIYENLEAVLELGYVVNGMDRSAWRKDADEKSCRNADAWKAALLVKYTF